MVNVATSEELVIAAIEKVSELARIKMLSKARLIVEIIDAKKEENETKEVQISIGGFRFKTEKDSILHASFVASIKNNFDCSTDSAPVSLDPELDFEEEKETVEVNESQEAEQEPATTEEDEHPPELPDADDERTEGKEEAGEPNWGDDYEQVED